MGWVGLGQFGLGRHVGLLFGPLTHNWLVLKMGWKAPTHTRGGLNWPGPPNTHLRWVGSVLPEQPRFKPNVAELEEVMIHTTNMSTDHFDFKIGET